MTFFETQSDLFINQTTVVKQLLDGVCLFLTVFSVMLIKPVVQDLTDSVPKVLQDLRLFPVFQGKRILL